MLVIFYLTCLKFKVTFIFELKTNTITVNTFELNNPHEQIDQWKTSLFSYYNLDPAIGNPGTHTHATIRAAWRAYLEINCEQAKSAELINNAPPAVQPFTQFAFVRTLSSSPSSSCEPFNVADACARVHTHTRTYTHTHIRPREHQLHNQQQQ